MARKKNKGLDGLLTKDWNFSAFKSSLQEKVKNNTPYKKIAALLDKLITFKRILEHFSLKELQGNGFNEWSLAYYKNALYNKLAEVTKIKSKALANDQLPGQGAFFGLGRPFDINRSTGTNHVNNYVYERQTAIENKITGKALKISFTLDKTVKGIYCVIEAALLQPSHIGAEQNPLHFIPEAQPRNRSTSKSGHDTPKLMAENLRPAEIIEGSTAYAGAPIVNVRGEVIQGNGRAYSLKYYWSLFPADDKGYKKYLITNAVCLGLKGDIRKYSHPVLVRMIDVTDEEAIILGQHTQGDTEAVASETTQIKSKAGKLSDKGLQRVIKELLQADDGDKTLAELIRSTNVFKPLIEDQVLRSDELEKYTKGGIITEAGVNFLSRFLLNIVFKDADVNVPDVFTQLPHSLQKGIEKSVLHLLRVPSEKSINLELSQAVLGLKQYFNYKDKTDAGVKVWANQKDVFEESPKDKFSALELAIIEQLALASKQKEVETLFKNYQTMVSDKEADMFSAGEPGLTKAAAVKKIFGIEISEEEKHGISKAKALALELELDLL